MSAKVFLDTNILLYSCSNATKDAAKKEKAIDLILNTPLTLSSQVLQEFISNALTKKELGISEANIDAMLKLATHAVVQPVDLNLIIKAVTLRRRFQLSHWDSTIIAAALELNCTTLFSEMLSHGQKFDDLEVLNPFL